MEPNELRTGNLVMTLDEEPEILSITRIDSVEGTIILDSFSEECNIENVGGVPLSKNFLLNFGFRLEKDQGYDFFRIDEDKHHSYHVTKCMPNNRKNKLWSVISKSDTDCWEFRSIQNVHELQNLYFSLTGLELKLNH